MLQSSHSNYSIEGLYAKHRAIWDHNQKFDSQRYGDLALRTHRAIRWCMRAQIEHQSNDVDVAFILYWITFNAAYASEIHESTYGERDAFSGYFDKLISLDKDNAIYNSIWRKFSGPVRILLRNRYIYKPFWNHANRKPGYEDWEKRFEKSRRTANRALAQSDTKTILSILFDRLYTLRNQLVHGGATWNSSVNRNSVQDSTRIIEFLLPIFIGIMLDNPSVDWGPPYYPPMN